MLGNTARASGKAAEASGNRSSNFSGRWLGWRKWIMQLPKMLALWELKSNILKLQFEKHY